MALKYDKHEIDDAVSDAYIRAAVKDFIASAESDCTPYAVYVNESNGLQALPLLHELGVSPCFCYIRSTHFERKQPNDAIRDIPDDMLASASMGYRILVVDYGARKDKSRAVWQGVPYLKYVLERAWLGKSPERVWLYPRSNTNPTKQDATCVFKQWYGDIEDGVLQRLMKYRGMAKASLCFDTGCRIEGISAPTSHDNDKAYYAELKERYCISR